MLTGEARAAISDLVHAAASLRPLADAGEPVRAPVEAAAPAAAGCVRPAEIVATVADVTGVRLLGPGGGPFDGVVTGRLRDAVSRPALASVPAAERSAVETTARAALAETVSAWRSPVEAVTADGARLRTYSAGRPGAPAVVLASACGMPAQLCEPWMRVLGREYHVLTWETRGLFGDLGTPAAFDALGHGVDAQAHDLLAVLDHHGVETAHVMGLCGGAVVALRAAGLSPHRVSALSLWHGDYELGPAVPKTSHQQNLKALMAMAARGRTDAAAINTALAGTATAAVPADVAHLVVYPYVTAELFYRYCVLTGAIMAHDVAALLDAVRQPAFVVTSGDDTTAHPAGSHHVAGALVAGHLTVEPHGDHISVFGAGERLARLMTGFLTRSAPLSV
jgi:3-oxoadipate enol-lactonase